METENENQTEQVTDDIKTAIDLQAAYPDIVAELVNVNLPKTIQDLQEFYPKLVTELREKVSQQTAELINQMSVKDVKEKMPELYDRIVIQINSKRGPAIKMKGFLLDQGDPYAAGTLRTYQSLKKVTDLKLPYVLQYKDKHTGAALKSYILRANGGSDIERAKAAQKALEKI